RRDRRILRCRLPRRDRVFRRRGSRTRRLRRRSADFTRVDRRLGSRIAAAEWLHRGHDDFVTRAARLNVARLQRIAREGNAWIGPVEDEARFIAECRETVWRELKRARPMR